MVLQNSFGIGEKCVTIKAGTFSLTFLANAKMH